MKKDFENLSSSEIILLLAGIKGIGDGTIRNIISDGDIHLERLLSKQQKRLKGLRGRDSISDDLAKMVRCGVKYLTPFDDKYPVMLKNVVDYPPILYAKGNMDLLGKVCISVVGTRKVTAYGKQCIERIVEGLVDRGVVIVSGMAFGVDAYAHEVALRCGGDVIAVLASGVDVPSPRSNYWLYEKILVNSGLVVSEQPVGTQPIPGFFPRRNRIISGMSVGTLVIEAGIRSGSIITARQAFEQNREVYAIPGDINRTFSRGTNYLIGEGIAKSVSSSEEIVKDLGFVVSSSKEKKVEFTSGDEELIYKMLLEDSMSLDSLVRESGKAVTEVSRVLTDMELKGMVTAVDSKYHVCL